jgi:hypothetical protein
MLMSSTSATPDSKFSSLDYMKLSGNIKKKKNLKEKEKTLFT